MWIGYGINLKCVPPWRWVSCCWSRWRCWPGRARWWSADPSCQQQPAQGKLVESELLNTMIWWKVKLLMSSNTSTSLALAWPWVLIYMLICMSHKHQELPKKWPKQPWKTKPHKINELRSRNKWFKITSGSENSCAIWCRVFFNPSSPFQMPKWKEKNC